MVGFTEEIRSFLASQRINESEVLDASRLSPRSYKYAMELEGKLFAIVRRPCYQGHYLRSRSGHCIQCDTRRIAFTKRHYKEAYVYIAGSQAARVVKVGSTSTPWEKEAYLNTIGYGDISDWKIPYYTKVPNAGKVEFNAHSQLSAYTRHVRLLIC
jgi:T5orf172 domain